MHLKQECITENKINYYIFVSIQIKTVEILYISILCISIFVKIM